MVNYVNHVHNSELKNTNDSEMTILRPNGRRTQ